MLWFCGWSFIYYVGLCYLVLCFPPKDTRKMSLSLRKIRKMRVSLYFSPSFSSLAVCHSEHRSYSEGLDNEHTRSHSNIVFNWRQPATSSLYVAPICCVWQCACVCFQIFPLSMGLLWLTSAIAGYHHLGFYRCHTNLSCWDRYSNSIRDCLTLISEGCHVSSPHTVILPICQSVWINLRCLLGLLPGKIIIINMTAKQSCVGQSLVPL